MRSDHLINSFGLYSNKLILETPAANNQTSLEAQVEDKQERKKKKVRGQESLLMNWYSDIMATETYMFLIVVYGRLLSFICCY